MTNGDETTVAEKCRYSGPDINELPEPVAAAVQEMMAQLSSDAILGVVRWTDNDNFLILPDGRSINPEDYRVFFGSDSCGLAQACFREGNEYYRVRIHGVSQTEKEQAMGYNKSNLEVLSDPGKLCVWNWFIEGERK